MVAEILLGSEALHSPYTDDLEVYESDMFHQVRDHSFRLLLFVVTAIKSKLKQNENITKITSK